MAASVGHHMKSRSRSPKKMQHHQHHQHHHNHKHHRVTEVVARHQTVFCSREDSLGDACDELVSSGRTAAVITDAHDKVKGVLTENDILAALLDGTPRDCKIDLWLRGGNARLPSFMTESLTVTPKTSVVEAAEVMRAYAEKDTGYACHHLLVAGDSHRPRLLSALDIVQSIISQSRDKAEAAAANMKVRQAMKSRSSIVVCKLSDKLSEAYRRMHESRQNCVLVVEGLGDFEGEKLVNELQLGQHIHGVVTAADALRTFSECQDGERCTVGGWLRGLTSAEHTTASQRSISAEASLAEAASMMTESGMHHLIVLAASRTEVVGVLSDLDIVCALGSREATSRATDGE